MNNIKYLICIVALLVMSVFMAGCNSENVEAVRNDYYGSDSSLTIGQAVDTYKYTKKAVWEDFEEERGRDAVVLKLHLKDYKIEDSIDVLDGVLSIGFIKVMANKDHKFEAHDFQFKCNVVGPGVPEPKPLTFDDINRAKSFIILNCIYKNQKIEF